MTSRIQMDDIQYRLEVTRKNIRDGSVEDGKLLELLEDCSGLRRKDPEGPFAEALGFIEQMLNLVRSNLANVQTLRGLVPGVLGPVGPQSGDSEPC